MSDLEVVATVPSKVEGQPDREIKVFYDFGDNLEEAVELFGEDVVFSRFKAAAVIDLQALLRRHGSAGEPTKENPNGRAPKTDDEIAKIVSEWKPGLVTRVRKSPKDKALELLQSLSAEDRDALLASL